MLVFGWTIAVNINQKHLMATIYFDFLRHFSDQKITGDEPPQSRILQVKALVERNRLLEAYHNEGGIDKIRVIFSSNTFPTTGTAQVLRNWDETDIVELPLFPKRKDRIEQFNFFLFFVRLSNRLFKRTVRHPALIARYSSIAARRVKRATRRYVGKEDGVVVVVVHPVVGNIIPCYLYADGKENPHVLSNNLLPGDRIRVTEVDGKPQEIKFIPLYRGV